jgi:hypothetical protein
VPFPISILSAMCPVRGAGREEKKNAKQALLMYRVEGSVLEELGAGSADLSG